MNLRDPHSRPNFHAKRLWRFPGPCSAEAVRIGAAAKSFSHHAQVKSTVVGEVPDVTVVLLSSNRRSASQECTMTYRLFGAAGAIALAGFAAVPCNATSFADGVGATVAPQTAQRPAAAVELAMGPTSAPQKPGGTGEAPADTPPHKVTKHKQRHS
jgi:hypothetical protein